MTVIYVFPKRESVVSFKCCNPDPVGEPEVGEKEVPPPPQSESEQQEKSQKINPADFLQKTGPGIGKFPIYW